MQGLVEVLFPERDSANSFAKGRIRDFGRGESTPSKVVGGVGCEASLGRLVAVNGIGEYSLEKVTAISTLIHHDCGTRTLCMVVLISSVASMVSVPAVLFILTTVAVTPEPLAQNWTTRERASLSSGPPKNGRKIC